MDENALLIDVHRRAGAGLRVRVRDAGSSNFHSSAIDRSGPPAARESASRRAVLPDPTETRRSEFSEVGSDVTQPGRELREPGQQSVDFLATVGHELANPLAAARNALAIIRRTDPTDPKVQWSLGVIERQIVHLSRLVDGFLELGRLAHGKVRLNKRQLLVADVIRRAVEMIRPLIDTHRQFLTVALPSEPLFIDGDLARLTQVVGNVLHNAVKYTPDGGLISIRLECAGNQAVLAVADTGIGIASALLPHVFDSFTQAGGAANGSNHGLGIGLTVARQLIEEHGGCIEANSDGEGRGSEFVVRIPLISTAESPDSPPPTMASQQVTQTRRILLVDDSVDAAESIGILGNLPGNEVCWTLRADSGVRLAGDFRPHLVVLDLGSRDVDGPGVARRVREQAGATQPVIVSVMTRHRPEPDCSRAPQANFDRYVAKPIDGNAWKALIAALGSDCESARHESTTAH